MALLLKKTRLWRIGSRSFPLYSSFGAQTYGARWNSIGTEVIYAAASLEGAILEVGVHTGGVPPPSNFGFIWIDLPKGLSYEKVPRSLIPGWRTHENRTRDFGDMWVRECRSCVLIVPSIVVPAPCSNYLINPNHHEAFRIRHLLEPRPLRWDPRL